MGIDGGPTAVGFGDLICVENNNYWFSLADLGYEGNVLIRANVTGQRTPAVSWLSIDKDKATLAAGEQQKLSVSTNAAKLGGDVYDAVIRMKTNDPLASSVKVPVYLDLSTPTSIKLLEGDAPSDFYVSADRRIVLNTSSHVAYIGGHRLRHQRRKRSSIAQRHVRGKGGDGRRDGQDSHNSRKINPKQHNFFT